MVRVNVKMFQDLTKYGTASPYITGLRPIRSCKKPAIRLPTILPMPKSEPIHDISSTATAKVRGDSTVCSSRIVGAIHPTPIPCEKVDKVAAKIEKKIKMSS